VKENYRRTHSGSAHQTVTAGIRLKTGQKTIRILPSKQKLSGHAGQTTFWGFLAMKKLREKLAGWLPHRPISPNASKPVEVAMGFIAGVLAGAERLTQIAHLRADPVLPEVMEVRKLPSQSTLTRFLQVFNGAACNLHCFRQALHWGMQLLPARREGYTLDLDGTGLLHEDGKQEGVRVGHTRVGLKPCLQPLLAAFAEIKICAQMWLRAGNAHAASNVVAFVQELFSNLPSHLRLRLVRGDSGFQYEPLLCLLEERRIAYVIAADLSRRIQSVIKKHTAWRQTALPGVEVADVIYESPSASRARRVVIIRRRIADDPRGGGKLLLDCPGYKYQALVTSLPGTVSALEVWLEYNGRAGIENVIKELRHGFGFAGLCCQKFFATEAALSFAVLTYNLSVLFARHLGWLERVTIATLRFRLFGCAGIISNCQGQTTLKLGIPPPHRDWWHQIWQKILSPFPNCNAVAQAP
jgi:Transposase DDE domain group 1